MIDRRKWLVATAGLAWCAACTPIEAERSRASTRGVAVGGARARQPSSSGLRSSSFLCEEGVGPGCATSRLVQPRSAALPALPAESRRAAQPPRGEAGPAEGEPPERVLSGLERNLVIEVHYSPDDPEHRHPQDGGRRRSTRLPATDHPSHVRATLDAARIALREFERFGFEDPVGPLDRQGRPHIIIALRSLGLVRGRTAPDLEWVEIERTLRGDALVHTVFHELFHRVQYAYNSFLTRDEHEGAVKAHQEGRPEAEAVILLQPMLREGGARLVEQILADGTTRYQEDAESWFSERPTSLFMSISGRRDAIDGSAYEGALFWKYVAEQHGTPVQASPEAPRGSALGITALVRHGRREAETQRILLEACKRSSGTVPGDPGYQRIALDDLRHARARMQGPGHFDRFWWFDVDQQPMLGCSETSWGNFLVAVALNGTAGNDTRFRFEDAAGWRGITAARQIIPESRRFTLSGLEEEDTLFGTGSLDGSGRLARGYGPETIERQSSEDQRDDAEDILGRMLRGDRPVRPERPTHMLAPYSSLTFRITVPPASQRLVRVRFTPEPGFEDGLVQVISLDRNGELLDLYRHDGAPAKAGSPRRPMDKIFPTRGVGEFVILVASRVHPGNFRLHLSRTAKAPLLYAASLNGLRGRHLTQDPGNFTYDWQSPDVIYRTGAMPAPHAAQMSGYFELVVRNLGSEAATGVSVRGEYASVGAPSARLDWQPLTQLYTMSRISTDAECEQALRLARGPVTAGTVSGTSCYINRQGEYDPYSRLSTNVFDFGWPRTVSRNGKLLRFTVTASNAPRRIDSPRSPEPLVILSMADSRPPPMPEGWRA